MRGDDSVDEIVKLDWPWRTVGLPCPRPSENVGAQHSRKLNLLRNLLQAFAEESRRLLPVDDAVLYGAKVGDVERTRSLRKADAASAC